jgi:hypothetical protein
MNIFYLSEDPDECARWMVDKHVVKMILETAQLLSTAHRVLDGDPDDGRLHDNLTNELLYKRTHKNHPSAIWARESDGNYRWLYRHLLALLKEYTFRYGKHHAVETKGISGRLRHFPFKIKQGLRTPMPSCMDEEYRISDDPVVNYRNYYKIGKAHLHNWKNRSPPDWITA